MIKLDYDRPNEFFNSVGMNEIEEAIRYLEGEVASSTIELQNMEKQNLKGLDVLHKEVDLELKIKICLELRNKLDAKRKSRDVLKDGTPTEIFGGIEVGRGSR